METKTDHIQKVTWNNALIYLHNFISEKLMDIIYNHNLNEEDACKLLSISEKDIYSAKEKYFIRNVKREELSELTTNNNWEGLWVLAR